MAKEKNDYFQMIAEQVACSHEAAVLLKSVIDGYDPEALEENRTRMHEIEHGADLKKHGMMAKLIREFITPIDREDLRELSETIDDSTDLIEDVLSKFYIYNVRQLRPEACAFAALISTCTEDLRQMAALLGEFKKNAQQLSSYVVEVNRLEEEGDRLYIECMAQLFRGETDFAEQLAWRDLFSSLEQCLDACEHISECIESVIIKNS